METTTLVFYVLLRHTYWRKVRSAPESRPHLPVQLFPAACRAHVSKQMLNGSQQGQPWEASG